jgi:hypothetical protein
VSHAGTDCRTKKTNDNEAMLTMLTTVQTLLPHCGKLREVLVSRENGKAPLQSVSIEK